MTQVTFKSNPIELSGSEVSEGDIIPNFIVPDDSLNQITLDDYRNKKKLISAIPSIDTGVCDSQTRKSSGEASAEDGVILTISVDLPFIQKRWCVSSGLDNVIILSDRKDLSFSRNYGPMIDKLYLLICPVFVLDENDKVIYKKAVSEGTNYPDFEAALKAYRSI